LNVLFADLSIALARALAHARAPIIARLSVIAGVPSNHLAITERAIKGYEGTQWEIVSFAC